MEKRKLFSLEIDYKKDRDMDRDIDNGNVEINILIYEPFLDSKFVQCILNKFFDKQFEEK